MNEILHILADPAHWVAEVVMDTTLMFLAVPAIKRIVRRHDRKVHDVEAPNALVANYGGTPENGSMNDPAKRIADSIWGDQR